MSPKLVYVMEAPVCSSKRSSTFSKFSCSAPDHAATTLSVVPDRSAPEVGAALDPVGAAAEVVAAVVVKWTLSSYGLADITASAYALKEGLLSEMLNV